MHAMVCSANRGTGATPHRLRGKRRCSRAGGCRLFLEHACLPLPFKPRRRRRCMLSSSLHPPPSSCNTSWAHSPAANKRHRQTLYTRCFGRRWSRAAPAPPPPHPSRYAVHCNSGRSSDGSSVCRRPRCCRR
ncbi:hypothetical protein, conserved [Leishmania donovani]|uniref:Uncharacterized protein n=1 Tax=Leishmania donovani TaxID=5661 RepID=E9B8R6_LEIDO|nr:hypothetical protein, conserved [Leishmania donovani]CBZ31639.1 hypothetical protein, conserved [Leishmania donovani]